MTHALALMLALAISRLRDPYYLSDLHKRGADYARGLHEQYNTSGGFTWTALVAIPFLLLLGVGALMRASWILDFAFALAMLSFTLKFQNYSYFLERLMRALYGNDRPQAEYLSRKWGGRAAFSPPDALRLCAERLHVDLFMPMFWFGIFGPAGLYLGLAHVIVGKMAPIPTFLDRAVRVPVEACSVLLTALAGNFGPAFGKIFTPQGVEESMVASSGLDPENADIEGIPGYKRLIERVLWAQCGFTVLLLLLG